MAYELSNKNVFFDLCISSDMEESSISLIRKLGYTTLAFNKTLEESVFITKKKAKSDSNEIVDIVPPPVDLSKMETDDCRGMTFLNRLTIQIGDVALLSKLNQSENMKKYDIIAVIPTSQTALNHACTTMDVDIISFNTEISNNCKMNRKLYKQAVEKGIHFEISYASALKDSTCRRNIIQRAHIYHTVGKSQHVLISSGAEDYFKIRSPYDIINFGKLLGLDEALSIRAITECARKVLLKADNRKRGKAAVFFMNSSMEQSEKDGRRKKLKLT